MFAQALPQGLIDKSIVNVGEKAVSVAALEAANLRYS